MSIDVNTTFDNVFKSPTADFTTVLMVFVPRRNPRVFDCLHHVTSRIPLYSFISVCGLFLFILLLQKEIIYAPQPCSISVVANILLIFHSFNLTLLAHHTMFGYNYCF